MINEINKINDVFVQASRDKTRFQYRGACSTEDLWDLSVGELDRLFQGLNAELKAEDAESLLSSKDKVPSGLGIQVSIIRHIVQVKLNDATAAEQEEVRRHKRARILEILADKQNEGLVAMSEEELSTMLDGLYGE